MRTIAELKVEAEFLGLEGDKISAFCEAQQKLEREERAAERDLEREKLAAEKE